MFYILLALFLIGGALVFWGIVTATEADEDDAGFHFKKDDKDKRN